MFAHLILSPLRSFPLFSMFKSTKLIIHKMSTNAAFPQFFCPLFRGSIELTKKFYLKKNISTYLIIYCWSCTYLYFFKLEFAHTQPNCFYLKCLELNCFKKWAVFLFSEFCAAASIFSYFVNKAQVYHYSIRFFASKKGSNSNE